VSVGWDWCFTITACLSKLMLSGFPQKSGPNPL
jgi:hypothetical protein